MENIVLMGFSNAFIQTEVFILYSYFIEVYSKWSDSWYVSVDLGNGVAPNWQQDITWPNANLIHWRIHLSPSSRVKSTF